MLDLNLSIIWTFLLIISFILRQSISVNQQYVMGRLKDPAHPMHDACAEWMKGRIKHIYRDLSGRQKRQQQTVVEYRVQRVLAEKAVLQASAGLGEEEVVHLIQS